MSDEILSKRPDRIGKYEILDLILDGGMGSVYRARDPLLDREVALKVILKGVDSGHARDRFEREAKIVASLAHPNVVAVHDFGYHNGSPFIVMEWLQGCDLADAMQAPGMPLDHGIDVICSVLDGLARAHQAGVIHRDIKPRNVFITSDGHVKILDFGVARRRDAVSMTDSGAILGTPCYMAPEQWKSASGADARSDLFSVGVMLYELTAGTVPFLGDDVVSTMVKITSDVPDFAPIHRRAPALVPVLAKALAKDAKNRYESAGQLASALRSIKLQTIASTVVPVDDENADAGATVRLSEQPTIVTPRPSPHWLDAQVQSNMSSHDWGTAFEDYRSESDPTEGTLWNQLAMLPRRPLIGVLIDLLGNALSGEQEWQCLVLLRHAIQDDRGRQWKDDVLTHVEPYVGRGGAVQHAALKLLET